MADQDSSVEWVLQPYDYHIKDICIFHTPCISGYGDYTGYVFQYTQKCFSCGKKPPKYIIFQAILLNKNYAIYYRNDVLSK